MFYTREIPRKTSKRDLFSPAHRNYGLLRKTGISRIAIFKIILIFKVNLTMEVRGGRVQTSFLKTQD